MKTLSVRVIALFLSLLMVISSAPLAVFAEEFANAEHSHDHEAEDHAEQATKVGDIDGNGSINAKDTIMLFRYVAGWDVDADEEVMDVNGDGIVNARDSILLFRYVAGWDVEIGPDPDEPVTDPDEPVTDPDEPVTDPDEPVTDPDEPVTDPDEPETNPDEPETDPDEPVTDPDEPETNPDEPETDPDEPVTDPDEPVTDPDEPVTDPDEPVTDPDEPVTDPDEPVTDPDEPVTDPDEPETDPDEPVTDPDEPETDPDEPETDPDEPVTDPDEPETDPVDPPHEHEPVVDKAVEATCTTDGLTEGSHCRTCGEILVAQTVVGKLGHDTYVLESHTPSCETDGYVLEHCNRCGKTIMKGYTPATGHLYGELETIVELSCATDGHYQQVCVKCGDIYRIDELANGHKFEAGISDENGFILYSCINCGFEKKEKQIQDTNEQNVTLQNVPTNFEFTVQGVATEEEVRALLYIVNTAYRDSDDELLRAQQYAEYQLISLGNDKWAVRTSQPYEKGEHYEITLSNGLSFTDYPGTVLTLWIYEEQKETVDYRDDMIFIVLPEAGSLLDGEIWYWVSEEGDYLYVELPIRGRFTDDLIGAPVCVGEYRSIDELMEDPGRICNFGKLSDIREYDNGRIQLVLIEPDLNEIFDELDVHYSGKVEIQEDDIPEGYDTYIMRQLYRSEGLAEFVASAAIASRQYASDRGLYAAGVEDYSFVDDLKFDFRLPQITAYDGGLRVTVYGALRIPLMNKKGEVVSKLDFIITAETVTNYSYDVNYEDRFWDYDKLDAYITVDNSFAFSFEVRVTNEKMPDAPELGVDEDAFYMTTFGRIHRADCRKLDSYKLPTLRKMTVDELEEYFRETRGECVAKECSICNPISRHMRTRMFVLNEDSKTVHCFNSKCADHLDATNVTLTDQIDQYSVAGYKYCPECRPDKLEEWIIENYMLNSLKQEDWGDVMKKAWNVIKNHGASPDVESSIPIVSVPIPLVFVELMLNISLEFDLKFEASVSFEYKAHNVSTFGARRTGRFTMELEKETTQGTSASQLFITGKIKASVGVRAEVTVSLIGCSWFAALGLYADMGFTATISGVLSIGTVYEYDENGEKTDTVAFGGLYYEVGFYLEVGLVIKILGIPIDLDFRLEVPLFSLGVQKVYYHADAGEEWASREFNRKVENRYVYLAELIRELTVRCYDVKALTDGSEVLSLFPAEGSGYTVQVTLKDANGNVHPYAYCQDNVIYITENAPCDFDIFVNFHFESDIKIESFLDLLRYPFARDKASFQMDDYVFILNVKGHRSKTIKAVAPTCTEGGNTYGEYCPNCGEVFTESTPLPALGHDYLDPYTCHDRPCQRANCAYVDLASTPHRYSNPMTIMMPGHENQTAEIQLCMDCKYIHSEQELVFSHNWSIDSLTLPTCSEKGEAILTCLDEDCGLRINYVLDEVDHRYFREEVTDNALYLTATCLEPAYYYYTCSYCDAIDKDSNHVFDYGEPLGHDWDTEKWSVDSQKGVHYHACKRKDCSERSMEELHTGGTATCTSSGTCTVCAAAYIDSLNHDYQYTDDPTTGKHRVTCSRCTLDEMKDHVLKDQTHDTNNHWQECNLCGGLANFATHDMKPQYNDDEHWTACTGCEYETAHVSHTEKDDYDEKYHWIACEDCDIKKDVSKHSMEYDVQDETHRHYCRNCAYSKESVEHTWKQKHNLIEHWECCEDCLFETERIKHTFDQEITSVRYRKNQASCDEAATYYYSCACGYHSTANRTFTVGEALGHEWANGWTLDPEKGTHYHKCTRTDPNTGLPCDTRDAEAKHVYDQKNTAEKYRKSLATCTEAATYYYSCVCGHYETTNDTFKDGDALNHTWADTWTTDPDKGTHYHKCTRTDPNTGLPCDTRDAEAKHVYDQKNTAEEYRKSLATCTEAATYYYSCACGYHSTANRTFTVGEALGHEWANGWTLDPEKGTHYHKCTRTDPNTGLPCDTRDAEAKHVYDQKNTAEMYRKSLATCTEAATYYYSCACGYHSTANRTFTVGEVLGHEWANGWTLDPEKGTHYHKCTRTDPNTGLPCDARDAEGKHVYDQKNTAVEYQSSKATCTEAATYYYSCVCGHYETANDTFKDGSELGHSWNPAWSHDGVNHYHSCKRENCAERKDEEAHTGGEFVCGKKRICEVCAKEYGNVVEHDYDGAAWYLDPVVDPENTYHFRDCQRENCTYINKALHRGGTETCQHGKVCDVCSVEYTAKKEDHNLIVVPDLPSDDEYHYTRCSYEGCGYVNTEEHDFKVDYSRLAKKATCTKNATFYLTCACGYHDPSNNTQEKPDTKLGHVYAVVHDSEQMLHYRQCTREDCDGLELDDQKQSYTVLPATCTEGARCSVCLYRFTPENGHSYVGKLYVNVTDKTHQRVCDVCGELDKETAHVHNEKSGMLAEKAKCGKKATYYYGCLCGHLSATSTYQDGEPGKHVSALGDWMKETFKDAAGKEIQQHYQLCDLCGEKFNVANHTYDRMVATDEYKYKDATCTKGTIYYLSCVCDQSSLNASNTFTYGPANGHKYKTDLSHNDEGHYYECEVCGVMDEESFRLHDNKKATCTESTICSICGWIDEATGHDFTSGAYYPDEASGKHFRFCVNTGCTEKSPLISHSYNQNVQSEEYLAFAATCDTNDKYYYSCVCGKADPSYRTFEIADTSLGHVWGTYWTYSDDDNHAKNCTREGCEAKKTEAHQNTELSCEQNEACKVCLHVFEYAPGHEFSDELSYSSSEHYYCCTNVFNGKTCSEKSAVDEHIMTGYRVTVKPTCAAKGTEVNSCSVCAYQTSRSIEKVRHSYDYSVTYTSEGVIDEETSTDEVTYYVYVIYVRCGNYDQCGATKEIARTSAKSDAKPEPEYSAPDCINNGHLLFYEDGNPDPVFDMVIEALGHDWDENDFCKRCGYKEKGYSTGLEFTSNGDGTCYVSGIGTCTDTNILIPPVSPMGEKVIAIGESAFRHNAQITGFVAPESLKTIGKEAFYGCSAMVDVEIQSHIQTIGDAAFGGMPNLHIIRFNAVNAVAIDGVFPNSGRTEGASLLVGGNVAFLPANLCRVNGSETSNLTIVKFLSGSVCTEIGQNAFNGCDRLLSVAFENEIYKIHEGAFSGCTSLESVYYGADSAWSDVPIGQNNGVLPSVQVHKPFDVSLYSLKYSSNEDGTACVIGKGSYVLSGDDVTVETYYGSDYVTSIRSFDMANGFPEMRKIHIPVSVKTVEAFAFSRCTGLTDVYYSGTASQWNQVKIDTLSLGMMNNRALLNATMHYTGYTDGLLYTSYGDGTCYVAGIGTCTDTDIFIPPVSPMGDKVVEIGPHAFYCAESIVSVTIPESVTSIGYFAFWGCNELVCVVLPASVAFIDEGAFGSCSKLNRVVIPDESLLTTISQRSFECCESLESIFIPKYVTSIAASSFDCCGVLRNITVDPNNTVYHVSGHNLIHTQSKTLVRGCELSTIPSDGTVTSIGVLAFSGCQGLTNLIIPECVTLINSYAFYGCSGLVSIDIPSNATLGGELTFCGCYDLKSIILPKGTSSIGSGMFMNCQNLTSIDIPEGVTKIGELAFQYCFSLSHVNIPFSMKTIDNNAFDSCIGLTDVYYNGTRTEWDNIDGVEEFDGATIHFLVPGYTVQYDGNGGTGHIASTYYERGMKVQLAINNFTRSGYMFLGWSTSSSSQEPMYTAGQDVTGIITGDITLYAVWLKVEYSASFAGPYTVDWNAEQSMVHKIQSERLLKYCPNVKITFSFHIKEETYCYQEAQLVGCWKNGTSTSTILSTGQIELGDGGVSSMTMSYVIKTKYEYFYNGLNLYFGSYQNTLGGDNWTLSNVQITYEFYP